MSFVGRLLTEDMEQVRQYLLPHPLWMGIEDGTLPRETLRVFALQDWWPVREAYHLDALAVADMPDLEMQGFLLAKLEPKIGGHQLLLRFGEALGGAQRDFDGVEPLAGCMALTTFLSWIPAYRSASENIAAIGAG